MRWFCTAYVPHVCIMNSVCASSCTVLASQALLSCSPAVPQLAFAYSAENWMTLLGWLLITSLVKALSTPARSEGTTICSSRGATSLSYCLLPPHPALNFQNQILK